MRLIPDSIAARTLVVLIVGLMVSHILSMALYLTDRTSALMLTRGEHIGERMTTIDRLIRNLSQGDRDRILELADDPKLHVTWSPESAIEDQEARSWKAGVLRDSLAAHLEDGGRRTFRLRYAETDIPETWQRHLHQERETGEADAMLMVSLQLPDRGWLNFAAPLQPPEPFWSLRFALSMVVMLLAVGVLSALVVRHVTQPLADFSRAAQRLGVDVKAPPLAIRGPAEVREAARAFNEMQQRIRRFLEDRMQMVAAISHDLGTPITRLRLRAKFVEEEEQRKKMLADLNDMEKMVSSALSFARDDAACEPHVMVDFRTLLRRVCDNISDAGHRVSLETDSEAVPYGCRPVALRRALTNLIENAVTYGEQARVFLHRSEDGISIRIDDDGPGIPEELHEEVFKPFRRIDVSRSRETGGVGLGLTVARTIIRAHGGDVTLENRPDGGLRVAVDLPL